MHDYINICQMALKNIIHLKLCMCKIEKIYVICWIILFRNPHFYWKPCFYWQDPNNLIKYELSRYQNIFCCAKLYTVAVQSGIKIVHGPKWLFKYLNMCALLEGSKGLLIAWLYLS